MGEVNRYSLPHSPNKKVEEAELAYSIAQEIEEARGNMTSESERFTSEKQKSAMKSEAKTLTPIEENYRTEPTPENDNSKHTQDGS